MATNLAHRLLCSPGKWATTVESELLPWVLGGVELGDNVLEIGPGLLHHIPTAELQDRLFAEAFRDICNPLTADALPRRLGAAGFVDVATDVNGGRLRWRAVKADR